MIKRFNRYELKYLVNAPQYRGLVKDLQNFMVPDAYGDVDGFYRVVSLYYDSPHLTGYHSKIEGLKFRRKLRIRVYPGTNVTQVQTAFVEIKQRINRTVQKRRIVLPLDAAERLCSGTRFPTDLDEADTATANEIAYMQRALTLRPKAIVSYRRQAFMGGRYERGMRLTFDMKLQGRMHALRVNEIAKNRYCFPLDWFVMEVKVNERIPNWVLTLLAKHDCQLSRISKYCAVVSHERAHLGAAWRHKENLYG